MKPLHERLTELRESVKLTRQAFAQRIGIDQSTYSRYELGQTKPSLDTLEKISLTFPTIDARWLLTGKGEMKANPSQPADPATAPIVASPLAVVADPEEVKQLKEDNRWLREQLALWQKIATSGVDLSKLASTGTDGSFNADERLAAELRQPTMWILGESQEMAA